MVMTAVCQEGHFATLVQRWARGPPARVLQPGPWAPCPASGGGARRCRVRPPRPPVTARAPCGTCPCTGLKRRLLGPSATLRGSWASCPLPGVMRQALPCGAAGLLPGGAGTYTGWGWQLSCSALRAVPLCVQASLDLAGGRAAPPVGPETAPAMQAWRRLARGALGWSLRPGRAQASCGLCLAGGRSRVGWRPSSQAGKLRLSLFRVWGRSLVACGPLPRRL
jgi:hypothetical protein